LKKVSGAEWFFIIALLLFATGLRMVGISNGQPDPQYARSTYPKQMINVQTPLQPDEYFHTTIPLAMLIKHDLNPHWFEYPSGFMYFNFATFWLTGSGQGISVADWAGKSSRVYAPFTLYVLVRGYSVLGGLLAVAAAYGVARLIAGQFAAAAAGMIVAVSFTMVQHSHYATQSSVCTGLAAVSIWASVACLYGKHSTMRLLMLSGVTAGLAAGTRYNAAGVAIVVFLVGCVLLYRHRARHMLWSVIVAWIAVPAAFLFTTPYAIFDFQTFIKDFSYLTGQYASTAQNILPLFVVSPLKGLWINYQYLTTFSLGIPATICAILGVWVAWRRRPAPTDFLRLNTITLAAAILLIYMAAYSFVVLRNVRPADGDHLLMLVIPVCGILAGVGADGLYQNVRLPKVVLAPILIALLGTVPLSLSLQWLRLQTQPETRYQVQGWVYQHLPLGAKIHLSGPYNVPLDNADYPTKQTFGDGIVSLDDLRAGGFGYLIYSDGSAFQTSRWTKDDPYLQKQLEFKALLDRSFPRIASIERPTWSGYDWGMNSAATWHNPGLVVYCLTPASCAAVH
jgi:hypothetical protein